MRRLLVTAFAALLLAPAAAHAADFCVDSPACPAGGTTFGDIQAALNAAAGSGGRDNVYVGGTQAENANIASGNEVDLIGTDATLVSDGVSTVGLSVNEPASVVSNFTIEVPSNQNNYRGLFLTGTARNVTIRAAAGTGYMNRTGLVVEGGTFEGGSVTLPITRQDLAILSLNGALSTIRDTSATGGIGINFGGPNNARIERASVTAETGIVAIGGTLDVTDSVIRTQRLPGVVLPTAGLHVQASTGGSTTVRARHLTILGPTAADTNGVRVLNDVAFAVSTLTLRDSIVRGHEVDVFRQATSGEAHLDLDYSNFHTTGGSDTAPGSGTATVGEHNLDVDPMFVAADDARLDKCSPMVDRGSPEALAAGSSTTDRGGAPRVVDGNGDGSALGDIGAFEYQPPPRCGDAPPVEPPVDPPLAPVLSGLTLRPAAFRAAGRGASARELPRRGRVGSVVSYELDKAAAVTFKVRRLRPGRRNAAGRCVKPTRRNRARPRCTRSRAVRGQIARAGVAGLNQFVLTGRLRGRKLRRGRYVLRAVPRALDLTGARVSRRFRIVRSR